MGASLSSPSAEAAASGNGGRRKGRKPRAPDEPTLPPPPVIILGPPGDRHLEVRFSGGTVRGILAEAGAMVWMTPDVSVETSLSGGVLKALKRVFASETAFVNLFSGSSGQVAFAPDFPCDILELVVRAGDSLELAAGAFLACEDGISISGRLTLLGGLLGLSDLVGTLVKNETSADRKVWIAANGASRMHVLGPADRLNVDNHRVLACTPGTKKRPDKVGGGLVSAVFGGEGIVTCFEGPGTVWTQTRRSFPYLIEKVAASRDSGGMHVALVGGVVPVVGEQSQQQQQQPQGYDETAPQQQQTQGYDGWAAAPQAQADAGQGGGVRTKAKPKAINKNNIRKNKKTVKIKKAK